MYLFTWVYDKLLRTNCYQDILLRFSIVTKTFFTTFGIVVDPVHLSRYQSVFQAVCISSVRNDIFMGCRHYSFKGMSCLETETVSSMTLQECDVFL